jgi:hypothetical protein
MKSISYTLICITLLSFISNPAFSQTSLLLGGVVKELGDELSQAIDDAKNAGLNLEVEAGREISISLENFKNVYASSLNLTMNKLDTTVTSQLETIKSLIDNVKNAAITSLDDFTTKAQQIVNALPFRKHEPQLSSITPRNVVPSSVIYNIVITCNGNFEAAGLPGYAPTLTIGTTNYTATGSNQSIQFSIPSSVISNAPGVTANTLGNVIGALQVPWKDSRFLGIFYKKTVDKYNILIGTLPKEPGTITLINTITNPRHREQPFVSSEHYQTSAVDGQNNDHNDVPWPATPDDGWTVKRNTSNFITDWQTGVWSQTFKSDDGNVVQYNVTTIHKAWGTSGQVKFKIGFTEYIDDTYQTFDSTSIHLNWGDSKIIDGGPGTWKIVFKAFDGTTSEFTGEDNSNPYLTINKSGMSYVLATANPATLAR